MKIHAAVIVAAMAAWHPSFAGGMTGGATEITQLLNMFQLTMQQITQEMQYATQLTQHATQLKQLQTQIKNLNPGELVGFTEQQQQIIEAATSAKRVLDSGRDLYRGLERLEGMAKGAQYEWAASDLTWENYLQRRINESERQHNRRAVLSAEEARVMNDVVEKSAVLQRYAQEIPRSQGQHEALQIMNGQMNMLVSSLQDQLRFNAMVSATQTEERLLQTEQQHERDSAVQEMVDLHEAANARSRAALEQLMSGGGRR